jgi:hypothetical protein
MDLRDGWFYGHFAECFPQAAQQLNALKHSTEVPNLLEAMLYRLPFNT